MRGFNCLCWLIVLIILGTVFVGCVSGYNQAKEKYQAQISQRG